MQYFADKKRHLICVPYSVENLHAMAASLEIKRCWYHGGKRAHYDIPKRRLDELLQHPDVIVVTERELYEMIRGKHEAARDAQARKADSEGIGKESNGSGGRDRASVKPRQPRCYVIYEKPPDFPDHFVVRPHYASEEPANHEHVPGPPGSEQIANSLEEARALIPQELVRFPRDAGDSPRIVETWL